MALKQVKPSALETFLARITGWRAAGSRTSSRGNRSSSGHVVTHRDFNELVTLMNDIMPDPDEVLEAAGLTPAEYRVTLVDAHVAGALNQRKSRTKLSELRWDAGKNPDGTESTAADQALEVVRRQFDAIAGNRGIRPIINEVLDAPYFGMSPMELFWDRVPMAKERPNGEITLTNIMQKPFEWFAFDEDGNLGIKSDLSTSIYTLYQIPENKIVNVVNDGTYRNPYGDRACKRCYWPYIFKKGGSRFWSEFIEKYGMPFLWGHLDGKKGETDFDTFYNSLVNMVRNGIIVTRDSEPNNNRIDVVETKSRNSSSDAYKTYKNAWNIEISKAILGETLTIENSETGSQAATKIHEGQLRDLQDQDKKMVIEFFNRVARIITDLNVGLDVPSPVADLINEREQEERDTKIIERDSKLRKDLGVKFTKEYIARTYAVDENDFEISEGSTEQPPAADLPPQGAKKAAPKAPAAAENDEEEKKQQFAEENPPFTIQEALDKYLDGRMSEIYGITRPAVDEIKRHVAEAQDFADLFGRIAGMKDQINNEKFGEVFSDILTVHQLAGEDAAIRNIL